MLELTWILETRWVEETTLAAEQEILEVLTGEPAVGWVARDLHRGLGVVAVGPGLSQEGDIEAAVDLYIESVLSCCCSSLGIFSNHIQILQFLNFRYMLGACHGRHHQHLHTVSSVLSHLP